jgi:hypothetical protein
MADEDVQITSLLPDDFTSGRWSGGRGTVTDVHYEYRKVQGSKGPFTVIETHVDIQDANGDDHKGIRYGAGFADAGCIREEPDEDSPEAERGYGLSGRNGKKFQLRQDTELAMLLVSAYTNGLPASRIGTDIRGLVGMDAEWVEKPHQGVKDDKYPMLLVTEVYGVGGKGSGKKKSKLADEEEEKPKKKAKVVEEEEEERPKKKSAGASDEGPSGAVVKRARKLVIAAAKENDGTTTAGDVARVAAKKLKGEVDEGDLSKEDRKAILELLGDDDWYSADDQSELWKFKAKTGEVILKD